MLLGAHQHNLVVLIGCHLHSDNSVASYACVAPLEDETDAAPAAQLAYSFASPAPPFARHFDVLFKLIRSLLLGKVEQLLLVMQLGWLLLDLCFYQAH